MTNLFNRSYKDIVATVRTVAGLPGLNLLQDDKPQNSWKKERKGTINLNLHFSFQLHLRDPRLNEEFQFSLTESGSEGRTDKALNGSHI